jgi:hypothetical protein
MNFLQFPTIYLALEEKEKEKSMNSTGPILAQDNPTTQETGSRAHALWQLCIEALSLLAKSK